MPSAPPIAPATTGSIDASAQDNNGAVVDDSVALSTCVDCVVTSVNVGQTGHSQGATVAQEGSAVVVVVVAGAELGASVVGTGVGATGTGVGRDVFGTGVGSGVGGGVGDGVGDDVAGKTKICNERRVKRRMLPACVASELLPDGKLPMVPLVCVDDPVVKPLKPSTTFSSLCT